MPSDPLSLGAGSDPLQPFMPVHGEGVQPADYLNELLRDPEILRRSIEQASQFAFGAGTLRGKPFWENMKGVRMAPIQATRESVLAKLVANGDFVPTLREGRMWFRSLSPAENEIMTRIGWSRAPDVTMEQETAPESARDAWERNIRYWLSLATPPKE